MMVLYIALVERRRGKLGLSLERLEETLFVKR